MRHVYKKAKVPYHGDNKGRTINSQDPPGTSRTQDERKFLQLSGGLKEPGDTVPPSQGATYNARPLTGLSQLAFHRTGPSDSHSRGRPRRPALKHCPSPPPEDPRLEGWVAKAGFAGAPRGRLKGAVPGLARHHHMPSPCASLSTRTARGRSDSIHWGACT